MRNVRFLWSLIGALILLLAVVSGAWYKGAGLATVAKVGDENVTEQALNSQLKERYGKQMLDRIIDHQLVFQEANRLQLTVSDQRVQEEIQRIRSHFPHEGDIPSEVQDRLGQTPAQMEQEVRYQLLLKKLATKNVTISDDELRAYFQQHQSDYIQPTTVHLYRLLVKTEAEAQNLFQELSKGADFITLAKERSIDAHTAPNGGDMGVVVLKDDSLTENEQFALQDMKVKEVSAPIPVEDGYALLHITERKEEVVPTFEQSKEKVFEDMAIAKAESFDEILNRLRKTTKVEVKDLTYR
ncbi:peptidylprolyl isomerase [Brevibacillus sp. 7WMA2]|uniref:peptidyl-prolyl cis-trans isomerase n=1 Tax=Brevibacillus sp. 7WMA2 TaxID=2683193 RepID=UPI0013A76DD8|nr:peptidyl-prolyl cis-trans isomerase [Brevibacillus sp. 7WMA2]QIC07074.1 peptidylprolyl isomerase [Brevibacillus sp. 7WMA2]WPS87982.1 peptidyl-prolyl cis-trans isomerase [Brevibacillus halotolerans]